MAEDPFPFTILHIIACSIKESWNIVTNLFPFPAAIIENVIMFYEIYIKKETDATKQCSLTSKSLPWVKFALFYNQTVEL